MSALDWGGGTGTNATPRYYTFTSPALPNSDWCIGIWVRKSAITGSATQELWGIGTPGATDSLYCYLGETSFGYTWGAEGYNSGGTNWLNTANSGTPAQDGNDYLQIVQRRSNVIEVVQVLEGATASAFDFTSSTVSGTVSAQASRIGYSSSNLANKNPLGEFFIFDDRALTLSQITTLAAGAPASVIATPKVLLRFRGGEVTTEANIGSGGATNDATKVSTGFATTTDFFAANPSITSVSTMTPRNTESFTITGTGFGATQGSGYVSLAGSTQYTTTSWSDTSITVTVERDTNPYGGPIEVIVIDNGLNGSNHYALTALLPQTGWDYVDIGTPDTTVANRITASPDIASGDQVAYDTVGGTVTVYSDGTFSVSSGTTSFNAEVWTNPDGWGGYGLQTISTWNVTGTGPRVYPGLGAPYGAGSYGAWVRSIAGSGSTVTQTGAAASSGQASGAVVVTARGASHTGSQAGGAFRTTVVVAGVSGVSSQTPASTAVRAAGASHVASQAQGGTVIAVISAGASSSSNQASGAVTVLANAAAHALAQAAAFSQIIARGETRGGAQTPAGVAWAAAGASQAISQTEGAAQSNAANATAGAAHSLAQAAAAVVVAAAGVSYSSSQAASGAAYAVAVPGESAASSGGAGGSTVLARGESAGNAAAAEGSLVATVVVPGVSQAASQAAGIGSDGSVVVSTHDACVGFIVNMGRLMHR